MKKIIVGFDATDQARDALHLGAVVARALGAELIVASAIELGLQINAGYSEFRAEHYERVFGQAAAELGGDAFQRRELHDTAAHGLADLAEAEHADLIVVGSTHRGPIGRVLSGTVAGRLFHGAPCAVMVAPRGWGEREHARPGLIGVGYDGSDEARIAVARAEDLAKAFGARLRVITIAPYIGQDAGFEPAEVLRETWADTLNEAVASISDQVETEQVLREGREATELALQGVDVDLLVVGSRGYGPLRRTLVGSVSGELVRTAPCPVLVVPRGAEAVSEAEAGPEAPVA